MHIILYVLDALRADHLHCYGYPRETSPSIDALARDGIVFENCFTASTWTRPVAASLLTGAYPAVHQTRSRYDRFAVNLPRLPEVLRAAGFKTAAFSTMGNIASEIGFNRGFDYYSDLFRDPTILAKRRRLDAAKEGLMHDLEADMALPRAEDINDHLLPWLEQQGGSNTFSFIWSIETHAPYIAPDNFRRFSPTTPTRPNEGEREDLRTAGPADRQRLMNLYDDEIYYNDHCLGRIIDYLKANDRYDETLLIVVGDHGDAFYEHGFYAHGQAPYEELIHVPLVMKLPGNLYAGQRVAALAELVDVFPTLIAASGLATEKAKQSYLQGHNLLPLITGSKESVRDYVFSDTRSLEIHNHYLSVRNHQWKYIRRQQPKRDTRTLATMIRYIFKRHMVWDMVRAPRHYLRSYLKGSNESLFDLTTDPYEQRNLVAERPAVTRQLRQVLADWQQHNEELAQQVSALPESYEENEVLRRHLAALGYL